MPAQTATAGAPSTVATAPNYREYVSEVVQLVETSPAFWTEALAMAHRAVNV
jgi:hypothetical protein